MSDSICICGHPVSEHTAMIGEDRGCRHMIGIYPGLEIECECNKLRPVLDWPDANGLWWTVNEYSRTLVMAYGAEHGAIYYHVFGAAQPYFKHTINDSPRFTKHLEPSPFPTAKK